jgi:hypothetical protein
MAATSARSKRKLGKWKRSLRTPARHLPDSSANGRQREAMAKQSQELAERPTRSEELVGGVGLLVEANRQFRGSNEALQRHDRVVCEAMAKRNPKITTDSAILQRGLARLKDEAKTKQQPSAASTPVQHSAG